MDNSEWRNYQIAASDIARNVAGCTFDNVGSPFVDFFFIVDGQRFGVEVKRGRPRHLKSVEDYLRMLYSNRNALNYPVLILFVDEVTEQVMHGVAAYRRYGETLVNQKVTYFESTKENWASTMKKLLINIQIMPIVDWRILKVISASFAAGQGNVHSATFYYMRKLSEDYQMRVPEFRSQNDRFEYYLHGIAQENFPTDLLDNAILHGIQNQFGQAEVVNRLIVVNTEVEEVFAMLRRGLRGTAELIISPDFVRLVESGEANNSVFKQFILPLDVCLASQTDYENYNGISMIYEDAADGWAENVPLYRKGLSSYQMASDYVQSMMRDRVATDSM